MNVELESIKKQYDTLDTATKILFLEWIHVTDNHKYDFATMPESLRRFYDATIKRPQSNH